MASCLVCWSPVPAAEDSPGNDYIAPGIDLPDGPGKALVLRACTRCHDLTAVPVFKGYWNQRQWLALVNNMKEHGARLDEAEAERVAAYLSAHFGR